MAKSRLLQPLPWYRWNPTQWQGSRKVQRMTWGERGLYRELMDECWIKGSVPSSVEGVAELFGADPDEVAILLPKIIRCFVVTNGSMYSEFVETVRTEMDEMRLANQQNARKRWDEVAKRRNAGKCDGIENDATASKTMRVEKSREEKRESTVPAAPERPAKKPLKVKEPKPVQVEPSLDEILGGHDSKNCERFWKFAGIWPKDRNPGPKSLARAWNAACLTDEPVNIYHGALIYRDGFLPPKREKDETQFMKAPLAWLTEEGWRAQINELPTEVAHA